MKGLGVDKAVDYHNDDWQQQVKDWCPKDVDAAIAIHPGTSAQSQNVVKSGGTIVTVSGDQLVPERNIQLRQVNDAASAKADLVDLFNQVAMGKTKLPIEKVYPFTDGLKALEKVKTRHTRGKLVLSMATAS